MLISHKLWHSNVFSWNIESFILFPRSLYVVWFTSALEYVLTSGRSHISGNTYSIFEMEPNCRCSWDPIHAVSSLLEVKRKICANNVKWRVRAALKYSWVDVLLQCYGMWKGAYTQGACDTYQTVWTKCKCGGEFNGRISELHGGWEKKMRMDNLDI